MTIVIHEIIIYDFSNNLRILHGTSKRDVFKQLITQHAKHALIFNKEGIDLSHDEMLDFAETNDVEFFQQLEFPECNYSTFTLDTDNWPSQNTVKENANEHVVL